MLSTTLNLKGPAVVELWRETLGEDGRAWLGALWGKSGRDRGGQPHLLLQHLFDSLAVGELVWDHYLASGPKARIDEIAGGDGRRFLSWLCGLHDVGKASPAFQSQAPDLARAVEATGLDGAARQLRSQRWRHELAGALIVYEALKAAWEDSAQAGWVWPMVAGHHGRFAALGEIDMPNRRPTFKKDCHGASEQWHAAQAALLDVVTSAAGYRDLAEVEPTGIPRRADQLLLSGLVIMADWIASSDVLVGVFDLDDVSVVNARERATRAWQQLGIRGGWDVLPGPPVELFEVRFGQTPRPAQSLGVEAARAMSSPGLLVLEAPTGEGKTEAALAAAEVMAARFGASGVFVGLPTQATSDPMFTRVRAWLETIDDPSSIVLLHGRRRFNEEWQQLVERSRRVRQRVDDGLDEHGLPDVYGSFVDVGLDGCGEHDGGTAAAVDWFLGAKRGLLAANAVGTVDQVLFAGTRTKHVMLRYAGLAGKVVILDEVHAADVYMSVFLGEVLRWLGEGRVPVILLSATLAPAQRAALVGHYAAGLLGRPDGIDTSWLWERDGYPSVTAIWDDGGLRSDVRCGGPWRAPSHVRVDVAEVPMDEIGGPVVEVLTDALSDGGCALVIRNSVRRAVETYDVLLETFEADELVLIHSRFAAADRARLTETLLSRLGGPDRPHRLVVVATQVAEQSLDLDADLLVTDLAPIDLLVQRAGRVHRHVRGDRPAKVASPRVVVTGLDRSQDGSTIKFPSVSELIYSRHLLLQSAAQVLEAAHRGGWQLPTEVPRLVAACYGDDDIVPEAWMADAATARQERDRELAARVARAKQHVLAAARQTTKATLEGLHEGRGSRGDEAEEVVRVRDGDDGPEVVLLRREEDGYAALDGTPLGPNGDAGPDHVESVLGGTVRLPSYGRFANLAEQARALGTLPAWRDRPWLGSIDVLVLDSRSSAQLGDYLLRYDRQRGLTVETR